uniref:hypothetical protein n=1 Tax=Nocardia donostiensis TaxID=1538463 RepID=UPI001FE884B0|nr:hypothetical protein [Nocardia donostiensis]
MNSQLLPKLLVSDADAAITYYTRALDAQVQLESPITTASSTTPNSHSAPSRSR